MIENREGDFKARSQRGKHEQSRKLRSSKTRFV